VQVEAQQVHQAITGDLEDRHLRGQEGRRGEEDRPPGQPHLPHDR
jgi:hypothetical protein